MSKQESFEKGFADGAGSSYGSCACGKTFYDGTGDCVDAKAWEQLTADPAAVALPYGISWMSFEGSNYVMDCECWKLRAARLMAFLDGHAHKIAKYFTEEKKRKLAEAASAATIEPNPPEENHG